MPNPSVVVFDVNETLSDMGPVAARFAEIGAPVPECLARLWFATLLRDGFALAAAGDSEDFAAIGSGVLGALLAGGQLDRDLDAAVRYVLEGFKDLPVHPDVPDGIRRLRAVGLRLVTLSNCSTAVAERLLATAGIAGEFEQLLSVQDAGIWKPAAGAYRHAARACGVDVGEMLMVAVHPWDIHGAARAGMATAWINRDGSRYPGHFAAPDHTVAVSTNSPDGCGHDRPAHAGPSRLAQAGLPPIVWELARSMRAVLTGACGSASAGLASRAVADADEIGPQTWVRGFLISCPLHSSRMRPSSGMNAGASGPS